MAGWIIAGAVVLLIVLYLIRQRLTGRAQREATFMERMRSSDMYVRLYPVLVKTRECCVERILIRPEEVRIILYKPMNREYRFEFEAHGLDNVDRPAALRALAQAPGLPAVFLGDSVTDVLAGDAAGVQAVGVAQDATRRDDLLAAGARAVVADLDELLHTPGGGPA